MNRLKFWLWISARIERIYLWILVIFRESFKYLKLAVMLSVIFIIFLLLIAVGPDLYGVVINDKDLDGLSDGREQSIGTNPLNKDTDGDRLLDSWEVKNKTPSGAKLPGADPLRKDLYVEINYAKGIQPLSPKEKHDLLEIWDVMPVENPSAERGVNIHVDDSSPDGGVLDRRITGNFRARVQLPDNSAGITRPDYTDFTAPQRRCVYHLALFVYPEREVTESSTRTVGTGDSPGYLVKIDGTKRSVSNNFSYSYRSRILTYELLHNVAGQIGGIYHTNDGWLSHRDEDEFLNETVASTLSNRGFNESSAYGESVC